MQPAIDLAAEGCRSWVPSMLVQRELYRLRRFPGSVATFLEGNDAPRGGPLRRRGRMALIRYRALAQIAAAGGPGAFYRRRSRRARHWKHYRANDGLLGERSGGCRAVITQRLVDRLPRRDRGDGARPVRRRDDGADAEDSRWLRSGGAGAQHGGQPPP